MTVRSVTLEEIIIILPVPFPHPFIEDGEIEQISIFAGIIYKPLGKACSPVYMGRPEQQVIIVRHLYIQIIIIGIAEIIQICNPGTGKKPKDSVTFFQDGESLVSYAIVHSPYCEVGHCYNIITLVMESCIDRRNKENSKQNEQEKELSRHTISFPRALKKSSFSRCCPMVMRIQVGNP